MVISTKSTSKKLVIRLLQKSLMMVFDEHDTLELNNMVLEENILLATTKYKIEQTILTLRNIT